MAGGASVRWKLEGIDSDGMGDISCLLGQPLDDPQALAGEDAFVLGLELEENVVGVGVDILQRFIGDELEGYPYPKVPGSRR